MKVLPASVRAQVSLRASQVSGAGTQCLTFQWQTGSFDHKTPHSLQVQGISLTNLQFVGGLGYVSLLVYLALHPVFAFCIAMECHRDPCAGGAYQTLQKQQGIRRDAWVSKAGHLQLGIVPFDYVKVLQGKVQALGANAWVVSILCLV